MKEVDFKADLHCHSTCSDGTDTPEELLYIAKEKALSGLSITDHDTIEAYSSNLFNLANKLNIKLLTGVEISSNLKNESIHVLGYNFDWQNENLLAFLKEVQEKRYERNLLILEKMKSFNMPIEESELYSDPLEIIGRPHIANLMISKGFVTSFKEAFDLYLRDGGLCYHPGHRYHPQEVIDVIKKAGGKAVLAHPHQIKSASILSQILTFDFDGIEAYYGLLHLNKEKRWLKLAEKKNVIPTGGSDYHGSGRPYLHLGASYVTKNVFDKLMK